MKSQIIFIPGPQKTKKSKLQNSIIFHRSKFASKNLIILNSLISKYFSFEKTIAFPFSATEAFDIFCNSLKKEYKKISLIHTGYWSENLNKVFSKNNFEVKKYENIFDYSEEELMNIFQKDKSEIFFSVICESSNSKIHDFENIYKVLNKLNKKLFIDAVSYPNYLNIRNNKIFNSDFLLLTSSKNFSSFPGLSFISFKKEADLNKFFEINNYLSLDLYNKFNLIGQMPHTFNATLALQVLKNFENIIENEQLICKKNLNKINYFKKKIAKLNCFETIELNSKFNSNIIIVKLIDLTSKEVIDALEEKNIMVGSDINQNNELRICISLETKIKEINYLLKNLLKIEKRKA